LAVLATQEIRRMRGGAQSHLMLASDGKLYVVKFQNNPQHIRVLANELLATRLAAGIGLTVPQCEVVEVTEWLIHNTPELIIDVRGGSERCRAGLQFGSQLVGGLMPGQVVDYLPEQLLLETRNLAEFAGILALDKWTCNVNGRQAVFQKTRRERRYRLTFIDQGYCFHGGDWRFADSPLRGVFASNAVYRGILGWESFEPWLTRIETFAASVLWEIAGGVPPEWYGGDLSTIESLVEQLLKRRERVRDLIVQFRDSSRNPFPNWGNKARISLGEAFPEAEWTKHTEGGGRVM
jgi:hypothetical protein